MLSSSERPAKRNEKLPHRTFQIPFGPGFMEEMVIRPALERNRYSIGWNVLSIQLVLCECLLNSSDILQELKSFDLIVFDSSAPCGVLVSQLLDIPTVVINVMGPLNYPLSLYHMVPMPVSYVPMQESGFTSRMTFLQRVANLGIYCVTTIVLDLFLDRSFDALKAKFHIKPERSFEEGIGDAELVIFSADFALEYPQPRLPV